MEFHESDWASVPEGVLLEILDCIVSIYDYARFGAVCKHWYCVAKYRRRQFRESWSRQLPLLMIPAADGRRDQRRLYNVVTGRTCDFLLSLHYNRRCVGYSHGWLATNSRNTIITLRNPFLNRAIHLPPLKGRLFQTRAPGWYDYDVNKVVLSHNPYLFPDRYTVMAIFPGNISLVVLMPGSDSWTHFERSHNDTDDIIYHKGMFLAVNRFGGLVEINCLNSSPTRETILPRAHQDEERLVDSRVYLVESSDGSLLSIRKYIDFDADVTTHFEVCRLVRSQNKVSKPYWEEIKSLGDEAVFVGDCHTLCILASNFPGCRPNSIYFAYDSIRVTQPRKLYDLGIFNLEDGSITGHYTCDDESLNNWPQAAWIVPTLGDEATVNPKNICAPHLQF